MSPEDQIRKASDQFYSAVNQMLNGDAKPLADIWSHDAAVTTMHPLGGREVGWDKVQELFGEVARIASEGQVKLGDQIIQVTGDGAYEVGVERGQVKFGGKPFPIEHRVTNIYRNEKGRWKIVHHHTDASMATMGVFSQT